MSLEASKRVYKPASQVEKQVEKLGRIDRSSTSWMWSPVVRMGR